MSSLYRCVQVSGLVSPDRTIEHPLALDNPRKSRRVLEHLTVGLEKPADHLPIAYDNRVRAKPIRVALINDERQEPVSGVRLGVVLALPIPMSRFEERHLRSEI